MYALPLPALRSAVCVAACCVLQCVAASPRVAGCCSVLQCFAVFCSVLQGLASQCGAVRYRVLQCVAGSYTSASRVAVC